MLNTKGFDPMFSDISFREKSAWAMAALFLLITLFYLIDAQPLSWREGVAPPVNQHMMKVMIAAIVGSVIVQIVLAAGHPREADTPADERERLFALRAGHWSGVVLTIGAVGGLLNYMVHANGNLLFHGILLSLLVATIVEHAALIWLFRRGA